MTTNIDKLLTDTNDALSRFVVDLATRPLDHLVDKLMVTIELEGEEEDHQRADNYRQQVEMIEAIGRFRFGRATFDDAAEKAAGHQDDDESPYPATDPDRERFNCRQ
jgi:hypothetical protein